MRRFLYGCLAAVLMVLSCPVMVSQGAAPTAQEEYGSPDKAPVYADTEEFCAAAENLFTNWGYSFPGGRFRKNDNGFEIHFGVYYTGTEGYLEVMDSDGARYCYLKVSASPIEELDQEQLEELVAYTATLFSGEEGDLRRLSGGMLAEMKQASQFKNVYTSSAYQRVNGVNYACHFIGSRVGYKSNDFNMIILLPGYMKKTFSQNPEIASITIPEMEDRQPLSASQEKTFRIEGRITSIYEEEGDTYVVISDGTDSITARFTASTRANTRAEMEAATVHYVSKIKAAPELLESPYLEYYCE